MENLLKNINVSVLVEAVNDYFYAEEEYQKFLRTWTGGWWTNKTAEQRENYTRLIERSTLHHNTVIMMCKLINVDLYTVFAMVKAINRWEKHGGKWDRDYCIHISYKNERNVKHFLSKKDEWETQYYHSTGRKISA
jgi:hypothetical protein